MKKSIFKIGAVIAAIVAVIALSVLLQNAGQEEEPEDSGPTAASVKAASLSQLSEQAGITLTASGEVKPESSVFAVAKMSGTLVNLSVREGDRVAAGQLLGLINNDSVDTSLQNARTSYQNTLQSNMTLLSLAEERVNQAQIGVQNAKQSVDSAIISLETAQRNLDNAAAVRQQNLKNLKEQNVVAFGNYLNTVSSALMSSNYIIGAESGARLPGIDSALAVRNSQSLIDARHYYHIANGDYEELSEAPLTTANIEYRLSQAIDMLESAKQTVDKTITALDSSVTGPDLSEAVLIQQKNTMTGVRQNVIAALSQAKQSLQTLENWELNTKSETDSLKSAVTSASNRLQLAQTGYDNALSQLESAKKSKEQQLAANESSLAAAQAQIDSILVNAGDLSVTAPISGRVVSKLAEAGEEVQPGARLLEIASDSGAKVEIWLDSRDASNITVGQEAVINNNIDGSIALIAPAVDSVTKKVKVEVVFDNQGNKLILGSFADVSIIVQSDKLVNLAEGYLVPLKAVSIGQNQSFVYLAKDGKAVKTTVDAGQVYGDQILVTGGLQADDLLIYEQAKTLTDGQAITIED